MTDLTINIQQYFLKSYNSYFSAIQYEAVSVEVVCCLAIQIRKKVYVLIWQLKDKNQDIYPDSDLTTVTFSDYQKLVVIFERQIISNK